MYCKMEEIELFTFTFQFAEAARPSFVARNIEDKELTSEEEATVRWTSGIMFAGGSDTVCKDVRSVCKS
jgi:hypothetical protein